MKNKDNRPLGRAMCQPQYFRQENAMYGGGEESRLGPEHSSYDLMESNASARMVVATGSSERQKTGKKNSGLA